MSHYSDEFTHSQYPYYACFKKNSSHELNITIQTAKTYTVRHCSREVYACTCTSMISHPLMIFSVFFKINYWYISRDGYHSNRDITFIDEIISFNIKSLIKKCISLIHVGDWIQ